MCHVSKRQHQATVNHSRFKLTRYVLHPSEFTPWFGYINNSKRGLSRQYKQKCRPIPINVTMSNFKFQFLHNRNDSEQDICIFVWQFIQHSHESGSASYQRGCLYSSEDLTLTLAAHWFYVPQHVVHLAEMRFKDCVVITSVIATVILCVDCVCMCSECISWLCTRSEMTE